MLTYSTSRSSLHWTGLKIAPYLKARFTPRATLMFARPIRGPFQKGCAALGVKSADTLRVRALFSPFGLRVRIGRGLEGIGQPRRKQHQHSNLAGSIAEPLRPSGRLSRWTGGGVPEMGVFGT